MKDNSVLEINVSEQIQMKDVPPGGGAPANDEKLPKEELEKRNNEVKEYKRLSARYCEPHNKKSRWVTPDDIDRVLVDGQDMVTMCGIPRGKYSGVAALAHSQIDNNDPLRFFVFPNGIVIINPVIVNSTKVTVDKKEGCLSFPDNDIKLNVKRFNKVTVMYQMFVKSSNDAKPSLSNVITEMLDGSRAHTFQHECGHINGFNIYDDLYKAEGSLGLGDGLIDKDEVNKLYI